MTKHLTDNMEMKFVRSVYRDRTSVPDFLLAHYEEIGLSDHELIELIRIFSCQEHGGEVISREKLRRLMPGNEVELQARLDSFVQRGYLTKIENGIADGYIDGYTIEGVYEKLLEIWAFQQSFPGGAPAADTKPYAKPDAIFDEEQVSAVKAVYELFEGEFARPLSPLELEKISAWLITDGWSAAMLKEAMRRAVMHGALSLAYIDRILLRWRREGIATPEQLAAAEGDLAERQEKAKSRQNTKNKKTAEPSFENSDEYSKYF
jgi:DNA replication protein